MKKIQRFVREALKDEPYPMMVAAGGIALFALSFSQPAFAQSNPFAQATTGAQTVATNLATLSLAIGSIGIIGCLMLGFFGKLNWKWVSTGVGVSFAIAIVGTAIRWLNSLGGGSGGMAPTGTG